MNGRERIHAAIHHREPDVVPLDLGATGQTGMNASTLYKLRREMGLKEHPIKVIEPFQMLGEIEDDMLDALGVDVVGLFNKTNMLGFKNENWNPWAMPDGTPVLMYGGFKVERDGKGNIAAYPNAAGARPTVVMTAEGSFFDAIPRKSDYDEDNLVPKADYKDDFAVADDETAKDWEARSIALYESTSRGIIGNLCGGGFGDVALVPAIFLANPKGIRTVEDWMMAHLLYPDYIREVFELQTDVMLKNLEIYKQAVGDRIQIVYISGTDFGTQQGTFTSAELFRDLYKPFYRRVNDWVHQNTNWKTFYHSCGAVAPLLDDFADMGADILNPVQCSAVGMSPETLKEKYGERLVFWGGGVDTQQTLPFGTPEAVRAQVAERFNIFRKNGGFVFATIHNVVANVPVQNLTAMFSALAALRRQ